MLRIIEGMLRKGMCRKGSVKALGIKMYIQHFGLTWHLIRIVRSLESRHFIISEK